MRITLSYLPQGDDYLPVLADMVHCVLTQGWTILNRIPHQTLPYAYSATASRLQICRHSGFSVYPLNLARRLRFLHLFLIAVKSNDFRRPIFPLVRLEAPLWLRPLHILPSQPAAYQCMFTPPGYFTCFILQRLFYSELNIYICA